MGAGDTEPDNLEVSRKGQRRTGFLGKAGDGAALALLGRFLLG